MGFSGNMSVNAAIKIIKLEIQINARRIKVVFLNAMNFN